MDKIYNQRSLKKELLWLLVELEYDSEIHDTIKVNRLIYNYHYIEDWKYFIKK